MFKTMSGPGVGGLHPANCDVKVVAREALSAGDICQFDLANADGDVSDNNPGSSASGLYNVLNPDATTLGSQTQSCFIYGVALEDIAADAVGTVRVRGIVNMLVPAACVAGSTMTVDVAGTLGAGIITTGASGDKIVAIGLEADTSNKADCLFNGVEGFGCDISGVTA